MGNRQLDFEAIKHNIEEKKLMKEALYFFKKNTAHIEVLRDSSVIKIYFPLLPSCKCLPKSAKQKFNEIVNRTSTKSKLRDLNNWSKDLIKIMKHEFKIKHFFKANIFLSFFAIHDRLWKELVFYTNIALNIIVFFFVI